VIGEPLAAIDLPAISPTHHVSRRRFTIEQQQRATGGFLNATAAGSRLGRP
jgi:hypothetical protein